MESCTDARPLIMSYLDGELSEAQAAPLRKHLLGCQPCRASAQDMKNVRRWFVESDPVAIPREFSARVARRAFQGDRGDGYGAAEGARMESDLVVVPAARRPGALAARARHATPDDGARTLRFVLALTTLAAALVVFASMAIRSLTLPGGADLRADDRTHVVPIERALEELDRLNAEDARTRPVVAPVRPDALRSGMVPNGAVPNGAVRDGAPAKRAAPETDGR
jgi:hypothetical protein